MSKKKQPYLAVLSLWWFTHWTQWAASHILSADREAGSGCTPHCNLLSILFPAGRPKKGVPGWNVAQISVCSRCGNVLCDIRVPLKSTQQYGSLLSHTLSLHKTGRGLCHSIMFCGPGNTWQVDTDSVNNSVKQTKTLGTQIDHKHGVNWKIKRLTLFFLPSISKNEMVPLR